MILILTFLLLQTTTMFSLQYDEDINLVSPAGYISHSSNELPDAKYFGLFNNCMCHESPDVVFCCGETCRDFPIVTVSVPLFKLKLSAVVTIYRNDFRQLSKIEALEIEGNELLTTIKPGCFKDMSKLRNLTIFNNYMLNYLDEKLFEGLQNLETLSMSKNGFTRAIDATRALSPKYVPSLELLDLSQNIFHSIEENNFHYMNGTELEQLNLNLCGIIYIHPNSLQPFRNLKSLRLGQNLCNKTTLTRLVGKMIDSGIPLDLLNLIASGFRKTLPLELLEAVGKSHISDIILARNHFDEIQDDSFPTMPHVTTMDLRECYISSVTNDAFQKCTNLTILLINRNRLTTVPKGVLIPNLTILDLAGNSDEDTYFYVPDRIFENLSVLENLQLSYNNIQYITNRTFVGLRSLSILNLKNTQLCYIEDGTFSQTPNLLHLNLMKNPLLTLMPMTSETFRGLGSVNVIMLGFCGIKNLTANPGLLHYFKNITFLALHNNEIQTIAPDQLTHLNKLQNIHLENNKLTPWIKEILPKNKLEELIAYQNKFTYITKAMLEDFKSAKRLSLDGNPIRCDCSLYPVVQWLKYNKLAVEYTDRTNFIAKCDNPDNWRKISIVAYLNYLTSNPTNCGETILTYTQMMLLLLLTIILIIILLMLYLFRWYIRYWIFLSKLSFMRYNFWVKTKNTEEHCEYEYDAFISYSIADKLWVSQLCDELEPALKLCLFERDFPVGTTISHAILRAVTTSRRTILIISEAFALSQWCRWETQLAQYHQLFFRQDSIDSPDDTLILIRLEAVRRHATPTLRYLIKSRIYLDWPQDPQKQVEFWNKLKATLARPKGEVNID